jgi:dTDP-4-dehydrorhamnose reductase
MVGREVVEAAHGRGWDVVGLGHAELDVAERAGVLATVAAVRADAVLNAAAYTRVDEAEANEETARRANAAGPAWLAEACASRSIPLVHISTDYVFDGRARRPYRPDDPARPLGVYGRTKWEGEQAVRQRLTRHVIVRTSWVYAPHGRNFLTTIARLAREREVIPVVADQRGCPTLAADLAHALLTAAAAAAATDLGGTYHFANAGETTWQSFASAIVAGLAGRPGIVCRSVKPISTAEYPTAAPRPAYSVLDTTSWTATFGAPPRPWRDALAEALCRVI